MPSFRMRQKWIRLGNSFFVSDSATGQRAAEVIGKIGFRTTSVIRSPEGREMATVREVLLAIDRTTTIERDGVEIARMQRFDPRATRSVYVIDVKGEEALRAVDSGFMDFRIHRGDACIATSARAPVGFLKQWDITMSDSEDAGLILGICVAIDQNETRPS